MMDSSIENVLLVLILITGFLMRLPYNNFPIDEDFGMHTYPAYFRERGIKLGRDFWTAFPPIYFVYILVQKIFGNRIKYVRHFSNYYNLLNIFAIFMVTDYLFGPSEALTAALIFAVFSASPYLGAYSCHMEGFYILPLALGILAIAHGITDNQAAYYIWGGAFIAAAFILKLVNIVYWFSFTVYLIFLQLYKEILYFSFSFAGVIALYTLAILFIYKGWNQQLRNQNQIRYKVTLNFINTNLKNNYKFDFPPIWTETGSIFLLSSLFLGYLFVIEKNIAENILIIWTLSTLIILVSQRIYLMYHFIPVVQSASVLSCLAIYKLSETHTLYPYYLSLPIIFPLIYFLAFNIYRKLRFFVQYKKDKKLLYFQKADQFFFIPEIAKHIREHTSSNDYIYIWGPFVQMYRLADRRSCEGHVFHFVRPYKHWNSLLFDEILNGIISKKPVYIVLIRPDFSMKVLKQITGLNYELERIFFNRYPVYRLKRKIAAPMKIKNMSREEKIKWLELLTPGSMDYKLDETYIRKGLYKKAMDEYQEAIKLNPKDNLMKLGLAALMRTMGNYEEALNIYGQLKENAGRIEWLHLEKAVTFEKMEKYNEALRELEKEERLFPGKVETTHILGTIYGKQKKYEKALQMFEETLTKKPEMEWVHLNKGIILSDAGKYEEALFEFKEEDSLFPDKADTKLVQGIVFKLQKKYEIALKAFQEALDINPSFSLAQFNMGVVFKLQKKYEIALKAFQEALDINPSFSLAQYSMNSIWETTGKIEEAKKGFLKIISTDSIPASLRGGCFFHLGKIFYEDGDIKKAEENLNKCLEFIPEHGEAVRILETLDNKTERVKGI